MSQNESHGQLCDVISICRRRNGKSIRRRKESNKNHNRLLLYLSLRTCPDIAYAITALAYQSANPSEDHLNKALYIYHYLNRTWNYSLDYDGHSELRIIACTNSDWGSDPTLCHS